MIDPRAIVDPAARVADGVTIGPYSIIGAAVEIESGTWIGPHVVVNGPTRIGRDNRIFQFASIGEIPQDKKYQGEASRLEIGDRNTIREYCTLNRGTALGGAVTRIGSDNWLMAYCHVAHDCAVGDHTIFANGSSLAGHVAVGDHAIFGAFTMVHQFCRIGAHSFSAMGTVITKDVPPFVMVAGNVARPYGVNVEGLRRRGFSAAEIANLRRAYKTIYKSGLRLEEAVEEVRHMVEEAAEVAPLAQFLAHQSERSIVR